ncbi:YhbD family protein [Rossellomorea sp. BNER]|uniref:YhbD family protein n=1 Tax=Rossellomorea sp. BNER TaxID=2962031 RepID=UPI003AF2CFA1|nr:YhbD family protein [Rossellomorea sp. BNER]
MTNDLISKKELLELTSISYGQLYRWKRKNLIPEEWFIRKSAFTGQETFFPREKVLERIDKIQTMKENLSLDELANMFSPNVTDICLRKNELLERNIVSKGAYSLYLEQNKEMSEFYFENILHIYLLEKLLQSGDINLEEGKMVIQLLQDVKQKNGVLFVFRKWGMTSCFLVTNYEGIQFEKGTKVVAQLSLIDLMEELKSKLY